MADNTETIFLAALERKTPEGRLAYAEGACAGDPELLEHVRKLLAAHEKSGGPLDTPPSEVGRSRTIDHTIAESPGTQIGPYKLLQLIGEGGMGVVYMAEQSQPVARRVALKIIKPGMDTGQVIARFEAERQALAMMDHPNIAKVLDAGATDSGRPYFVMELVKGIPISDYCDAEHFTPKQRLQLFVKVCQGVQHAHQKGIIHRDLKPSNVLVAEYDQQAVPKIIDFGVAKATSQKLTEKTMFTQYGQIVGTLEYMSPEQARLNQLDIDTRSDVYSLGVLLYHLLTGTTPFERERLRSAAFEEMLRIIREEEPPKPSTRISTLGKAAAALSGSRRTTPQKLHQTVRGELDWIVMKALEKERARRYESASSFALDIERFLHGQAVHACPPSAAYRVRKFVRRNWLVVTTAATILLALCLGLVGTSAGFFVAIQARNVAIQARNEEAQARQDAELHRALAEEQREEAEHQRRLVRGTLYFAEMNLAGQSAQQTNGIGQVVELLAHWRPGDGERDLRDWEWYYLETLCHQDRFTLSGHADSVTCVSWSSDGTRIASASEDQTIKIWDVIAQREIRTLYGHSDHVTAVAWSPDSRRLASAGKDQTVRIWDGATGSPVRTLPGHSGSVNSVCWSPDGTRLASAGEDMLIRIWNTTTGMPMGPMLRGHEGSINSVSWSPDGNRLASASGDAMAPGQPDQDIRTWDAASGEQVLVLPLSGKMMSVSWSPDSTRIASAGSHQPVRIWNASTGELTLDTRGEDAEYVSFDPNGRRIAVFGSDQHTVRVADVTTGRQIATLRGHTARGTSVHWSPDGNQLASASEDGTIKVWDATPQPEPLEMGGDTSDMWGLSWSPDGTRLASASYDGVGRVWDAATGAKLLELAGHESGGWLVSWSPTGDRLASSSYLDGTIKLWDAATGEELFALPGHTPKGTHEVFWNPKDGNLLASGGRDFNVKLWDLSQRKEIATLEGHQDDVCSICWSPDGTRLASVGFDGELRVWDLASRTILWTARHKRHLRTVRWSPDGRQVASAGFAGDLRIWDAVTGEQLHSLRDNSGLISSVSWSPSGTRLVSASFQGPVKVWDTATGAEVLTLPGNDHSRMAGWSPDGKKLAVASGAVPDQEHQLIKVWDATAAYELERQRRAESQ